MHRALCPLPRLRRSVRPEHSMPSGVGAFDPCPDGLIYRVELRCVLDCPPPFLHIRNDRRLATPAHTVAVPLAWGKAKAEFLCPAKSDARLPAR